MSRKDAIKKNYIRKKLKNIIAIKNEVKMKGKSCKMRA